MSHEPGNFAHSCWQIAKFHENQVHLWCPSTPTSQPRGHIWLQHLHPCSVRLRQSTTVHQSPRGPRPLSCPFHLLELWFWTLAMHRIIWKIFKITVLSPHSSPEKIRICGAESHSWDHWFMSQWKWKLAAQSCLTLCVPVDCSTSGSSVHEIS